MPEFAFLFRNLHLVLAKQPWQGGKLIPLDDWGTAAMSEAVYFQPHPIQSTNLLQFGQLGSLSSWYFSTIISLYFLCLNIFGSYIYIYLFYCCRFCRAQFFLLPIPSAPEVRSYSSTYYYTSFYLHFGPSVSKID